MCGKKRGTRSKGDTWWPYEELKDAVSIETYVHRVMCQNYTEEIRRRYNSMKNKVKKAVS